MTNILDMSDIMSIWYIYTCIYIDWYQQGDILINLTTIFLTWDKLFIPIYSKF
jgi:hypothetical protein